MSTTIILYGHCQKNFTYENKNGHLPEILLWTYAVFIAIFSIYHSLLRTIKVN